MSVFVQRSVIESFSFNGKSVRSVHVRGEGECLVAADVYTAVGYDRDSGRKAIQRLVPEKYKVRLGDVITDLEGVDKFVHPQGDQVLLKEPGLYTFLVRCKRAEADPFMEWAMEVVLPREVRKLAEEHQQAIKEKDNVIALLNDDLTEAQEHTRQLEFNNVGLQGEIRAKDQVIEDLIINRHVPRREDADNVLCIIDKMSTEPHQYYAIRRQSKSLETHLRQLRRRYPNMVEVGRCDDANAVHHWCRFKDDVIEKPNYYKNHFNLTAEKRELFETAFDLTIE